MLPSNVINYKYRKVHVHTKCTKIEKLFYIVLYLFIYLFKSNKFSLADHTRFISKTLQNLEDTKLLNTDTHMHTH